MIKHAYLQLPETIALWSAIDERYEAHQRRQAKIQIAVPGKITIENGVMRAVYPKREL